VAAVACLDPPGEAGVRVDESHAVADRGHLIEEPEYVWRV
jgi:hypothetical protein